MVKTKIKDKIDERDSVENKKFGPPEIRLPRFSLTSLEQDVLALKICKEVEASFRGRSPYQEDRSYWNDFLSAVEKRASEQLYALYVDAENKISKSNPKLIGNERYAKTIEMVVEDIGFLIKDYLGMSRNFVFNRVVEQAGFAGVWDENDPLGKEEYISKWKIFLYILGHLAPRKGKKK